MFFLNSDDINSVPDSMFFLHKIGLLKHKTSDVVAKESLYYLNGSTPELIWTEDSFSNRIVTAPFQQDEGAQTILVYDFVSGYNLNQFKGHNLIVIPHVYFDYVATIKNISQSEGINSFKIFSPHSRETALIPKKHLKSTLPFLTDQCFAQHILEIESIAKSTSPTASSSSAVGSIMHLFLKFMAELLLFLLKPITTTKLFFSKYNLKFFWGNLRVGLIKLFYFFYNFRFSVKRFAFRFSQIQYFFKSVYGRTRVALIKTGYVIVNLRFLVGPARVKLINLFFVVINTRFAIGSGFFTLLQKRYIFYTYNPRYFFGMAHVLLIKFFYRVVNVRFALWHALHSVYIFIRYNPLITLIKYLPVRMFGWAKVSFIKSFYFVYNLRFPIQHYLIVFYWFNFKYTLYPIRKTYWVFIHEFNKRVLAKFFHATKN